MLDSRRNIVRKTLVQSGGSKTTVPSLMSVQGRTHSMRSGKSGDLGGNSSRRSGKSPDLSDETCTFMHCIVSIYDATAILIAKSVKIGLNIRFV